jgi:hypothetical protein
VKRLLILAMLALLCGCGSVYRLAPLADVATVLVVVVDQDNVRMAGVNVTAYVGDSPKYKVTDAKGEARYTLNYMADYRVTIIAPTGYRCDPCELRCPANGGVTFRLLSDAEPTPTVKPSLTVAPSMTPSHTATATVIPTIASTPTATSTPWETLPSWVAEIVSWEAQQELGVDWATDGDLWAYATECGYTPVGLVQGGRFSGVDVTWVTCAETVLVAANGQVYEVGLWLAQPTPTPTNTRKPTRTQTPTATLTPEPTATPSQTPIPSATPTRTKTPVPSVTPTPAPTIIASTRWTVLLYGAADNNLDYWITRTISRIAWGEIPQVVVLYDGPGAYDSKVIWGDKANQFAEWGEVNTGDPETLRAFVAWARASFPSRQYVLSIMDHGKATQGIAYDDSSAKDRLTAVEIKQALAHQPADVLFLDACLMAEVSSLYEMRDVADVVIASANLGWSVFIENQIPRLIRELPPTHSASDVGIAIAKAYATACSNYPYTVAVFDQTQIHKALTPLKRLAEYEAALRIARKTVQMYDSQAEFLRLESAIDDFVDVRDLLRLTAFQVAATTAGNNDDQLTPYQLLQNEIAAMDSYVLYEDCRSGNASGVQVNLNNAHGLAVYFPTARKYAEYDLYIDGELFPEFTAACPEWMGIVNGAAWLETRGPLLESEVPPMLAP